MTNEIQNELPTDTVLDDDDTLSQAAADTMKAIYLLKAKALDFASERLTPTEIVNGMEELRVAGLLRVEIDGEYDTVRIAVLTPSGKILTYI